MTGSPWGEANHGLEAGEEGHAGVGGHRIRIERESVRWRRPGRSCGPQAGR